MDGVRMPSGSGRARRGRSLLAPLVGWALVLATAAGLGEAREADAARFSAGETVVVAAFVRRY